MRGAAVERLRGALETVAEVARLVRDDERGGGVEQRDVAIGDARAVEHGAQLRGVVLRVAALQVLGPAPSAGRLPRASW